MALGSRLAVLVGRPFCACPQQLLRPGPLDRLLLPAGWRFGQELWEHASEGSESRRSHQCTPDPVPGAGALSHRGPLPCRLACREGISWILLGSRGPAALGPGLPSLKLSPFLSNFLPEGGFSGRGVGAAEWTPEVLGGQGGSLSPWQPLQRAQASALVLPNPGLGKYWSYWPACVNLSEGNSDVS